MAGWGGLRVLRVERRPDGTEVRYLDGGNQWHLCLDGTQLIIAEYRSDPNDPCHWTGAAKQRAYNAVRRQVASGAWPDPRDVQCADCGAWALHYHHPRGYDPQHWLDVVALCGRCHTRRHDESRYG